MRLTGRSLAVAEAAQEDNFFDFQKIIDDAVALLKSSEDDENIPYSEARGALVATFSHILVDEYQDIDERQYEMISLLAGRTEKESDLKLSILAVGDDDQNIYRFRGTNVEFIRRFQADYTADIHYLVENYRSVDHIIAAANDLIEHNSDRMKTNHAIRINASRQGLPGGETGKSLILSVLAGCNGIESFNF